MIHRQRGNRGFIGKVLLIVTALVVLGLFGYSLKDAIDSAMVKENLSHLWDLAIKGWNIFIVTPALWLWGKIQALLPGGN